MIKFLIQSQIGKNNNLIPMQDFGYEVIKAVEYDEWLHNEKRYDYELITDFTFKSEGNNASKTEPYNFLTPEYIPVGSVEFVLEFMKQYYGVEDVRPLNIPLELMRFANRDVIYLSSSDLKNNLIADKVYFIKSNTKIKGYTSVINGSIDVTSIPEDVYMLSEYIDIQSEWRCFVKDGQLLDVRCYSGDFALQPSFSLIEEMIRKYKSCPPAYTLDVCVDADGNTSIIECHNFFSCGLYGFSNYSKYLIMLIRAFKWQIEKQSNLNR